MRALVTMTNDTARLRAELADTQAELEQARADRDDWQRLATEAVRVLVRHPDQYAELSQAIDVLDLMLGAGPPAV